MAATPLQPNNSGATPRRVTLRTSGPVPKTKVRLLGSNGKAIESQKAPAPAEEPAPVAEEAVVDDAALKAAEEADRLAQEEYERQMAEYEKQMEEYNRQMAEYEAAEEARKAAEAEEARLAEEARQAKLAAASAAAAEAAAELAASEAAAPAPAPKAAAAKPKLTVAKPAGLKPSGINLKPAGARAAAPEPTPTPEPAETATPEPAETAIPEAEAEPTPAEEQTAARPAAKAAPRISLPKAGATPKAAGKAKAKAKTAPAAEGGEELSEEELAAHEAYLESLQKQAEAPKIWKTPMFKYGCIAFGVMLAGLGVLAFLNNQKNKAIEEHRNYINQYLTIAQNLNQQGIETLADVKARNVKFSCPPEAAKDLLDLVVDPFVKRADGKNRFGANPEGVAQNACLVLAIAAEQNPEIDKLIFATLGEKCDKMKPSLFSWLLQRMSISNIKGVKGKLKKLAKTVADKPKWKQKTAVLSSVWSCIGLRVSPKDVDDIIALLKDDATEDQLTKTLCICLSNVTDMMDAGAERSAVADEIFEKAPEKQRERLIDSLAKAASPKALAFYKQELEDDATWSNDGQLRFANALRFCASYGDDEIIDYLLSLKKKAGDDKAAQARAVDSAIQTAFVQNRERSDEDAQRLIGLIFDKITEDTSEWENIIAKTDPDSADFVCPGMSKAEYEKAPAYKELMERKADLEKCRVQKNQLITSLATLRDFKWVTNMLQTYANDGDYDISSKAKAALDRVKKNTAAHVQLQSRYSARSKD